MSYTNNFYNINMLPDEEIKRRLRTPLSDDDVDKYFEGHKTEILKYSALENFNTIDELMPKPFDYKIILIETKQNQGHKRASGSEHKGGESNTALTTTSWVS